MRKKDVEELVKDYMKIWTAGRLKWLDRTADKRLTVRYSHYPDKLKLEAFRSSLEQTHAMFPDIKLKITRLTVGDNLAIAEWVYTATHTTGQLFGIKATGKKVKVMGISRIEVQDGRVIKETGVVDHLALAQQIGAIEKK